MVEFGFHLTSIPDRDAGQTPRELLEQHLLLAAKIEVDQHLLDRLGADAGRESVLAIFILRGEQLSTEDRTLLQTAARAVLLSRRGSLADQVIRLERPERIAPPATPTASRQTRSEAAGAAPRRW